MKRKYPWVYHKSSYTPIIRYVDYNSNAACLLDYTHISTPVKYCLCFNYMILDILRDNFSSQYCTFKVHS